MLLTAVAVALRNQKVAVSSDSGHVTRSSEAVQFPELSELTLCVEVERLGHQQVSRTTPPAGGRGEPPFVTSFQSR